MQKKIPFEFVLEYLLPLEVKIKPMFGCHAIYVKEKIVMALRKSKEHAEANGIWIPTSKKHHGSLKKIFPSMKSIGLLSNGKAETNWQMIAETADDFESSAVKLCEMILKGDERIGKQWLIPITNWFAKLWSGYTSQQGYNLFGNSIMFGIKNECRFFLFAFENRFPFF